MKFVTICRFTTRIFMISKRLEYVRLLVVTKLKSATQNTNQTYDCMRCPNFKRQENGSGSLISTYSLRHIDERYSFRNQYAREHAREINYLFLSVLVPVCVCVYFLLSMLCFFLLILHCIRHDVSEHKQ